MIGFIELFADKTPSNMPLDWVIVNNDQVAASNFLEFSYNHDSKTLTRTGEPPTQFSYWDFAKLAWSDSRTLAELRSQQWEKIKQARSAEIQSPLVTPYGTFDADTNSRTAITDSVLLLQTLSRGGRPATLGFTLADNSKVDLSVSQMENVGLMLGERTNTIYNKGRLLRAAIDAAVSLEEVEAVVW